MDVKVFPRQEDAIIAAADRLAALLAGPGTRTFMPAAGNTPLPLYRRMRARLVQPERLEVFVLDEYAGVPADDPRNCANVLRREVRDAWGIPPERFHAISSVEEEAAASVEAHERRIQAAGGIDVLVLGLGQNGHLGFNEPGSAEGSRARVLDLAPTSVEANRIWFGGDHAPARGATVGLRTILAARSILLLAFGKSKARAAANMIRGPRGAECPASWLRGHGRVEVYLDHAAGGGETGE